MRAVRVVDSNNVQKTSNYLPIEEVSEWNIPFQETSHEAIVLQGKKNFIESQPKGNLVRYKPYKMQLAIKNYLKIALLINHNQII